MAVPPSGLPGLPPPPGRPGEPRGAGEFTPERILAAGTVVPTRGWRAVLYRLTGGRLNPGASAEEQEERLLAARAKRPIPDCHHIAVMTLKGGEGKTTTTVMLGHMLASLRGDRVVAVDASPDSGTLGYRIRRETAADVLDLLRDVDKIDTYADVRAYTSQAPSRLEVVVSESDAARITAFGADGYRTVADVLSRFYSLVITDCGPGVVHDAMRAILQRVNQVIVVASPSLDGVKSAALTLDWLESSGRGELVQDAIVVLNSVRKGLPISDAAVIQHFTHRVRAIVRVPWDPHLATGAETDLWAIRPATRRAYLGLAAVVADRFGADRQPTGQASTP